MTYSRRVWLLGVPFLAGGLLLAGCGSPQTEEPLSLPSAVESTPSVPGVPGTPRPVPSPTATAEADPVFEGLPLDELPQVGDVEGFTSEQVKEGIGFASTVAVSMLYPLSLWHEEFTVGIPEEQRYAYPLGWMTEAAVTEWAANTLTFAADPKYVSVLLTEPPVVGGEWVYPAVDVFTVDRVSATSGGVDEATGFPVLDVTVGVSGTAVYQQSGTYFSIPVRKTTTLGLVQTGQQIETWKIADWSGEPAVFGEPERLPGLPQGRSEKAPTVTPPSPPEDLSSPVVGSIPEEVPPGMDVSTPAPGVPDGAPE